jgi:hypothetical protein
LLLLLLPVSYSAEEERLSIHAVHTAFSFPHWGISLLVHTQMTEISTSLGHPCSHLNCSVIRSSQFKSPSMVNGLKRNWGVWNISLRKGHPAICDNMGEPGRHLLSKLSKTNSAESRVYMES